jgi:hypothetical protein
MLVATATILAASAQAQIVNFHVAPSPTGNDANAGTALAPYATLNKAFTEAASATPPADYVVTADGITLLRAAFAWADNVTLPVSGPNNQAALIVGNDVTLAFGDQFLKEQLEAAGYVVEVVDDANTNDGGSYTATQANAKNLVVISETVGSGNLENLFGITAPVINCEPFSWDEFGYSTNANVNATDQTQIAVLAAGDPLLGGLTGNITVYNAPYTVNANNGAFDVDIVKVASVVGNATDVSLWRAEAGTVSTTGRTVGFFMFGSLAGFGSIPSSFAVNVLVTEGTYAETNLTMPGLTLEGGWNSAFSANSGTATNTIIDGTNTGQLIGLAGQDSTIRNISLRNANAVASGSDGGALRQTVAITTLTIENCIFTGNTSGNADPGRYGTIFLDNIGGIVDIKNTVFDANGGDATTDAPIRIETTLASGAEVRFTTCTFTNNVIQRRLFDNDDGGASTFIGCTFRGNTTNNGSLLRVRRQTGVFSVTNSTFDENTLGGGGGRLFEVDDVQASDGSLIVEGCTITSNTTNALIGMIDDSAAPLAFTTRFVNNVVAGNNTGDPGTNIMGGTIVIANNSFDNNDGTGGSLLQIGNASAVAGFQARVTNNIFTDNTDYSAGIVGSTGINAWTSVQNNIFHDNEGDPNPGTTDGTVEITLDGRLTGNGNFDADPLYTNRVKPAWDLSLPGNSQAVDAGTPVSGVTTDIEGKFRPQGGGFDIGAFEFPGGIVNSVEYWTIY